MVDKVILVVIFMSFLFMVQVTLRYAPNMNERYTYEVYRANAVFLLIRAITFTLFTLGAIDATANSILSGIISSGITVYFAIHIHQNFGNKAIERKQIHDLLGAKESFFENTELTVFIKEYDAELDEFVAVYVNKKFNEVVHKRNGKPDNDCIGKTNAYWGDLKGEYDRQDREAFFGNKSININSDWVDGGELKKGNFLKHRSGNYLYGYGMI